MPTKPEQKPSRTTSKRAKYLPQLPTKSRPGLAVDTSFSRHHGRTPEQVFPYQTNTEESGFVSLSDKRSVGHNGSTKARRKGTGRLKDQLENTTYMPPFLQKKTAGSNAQLQVGTSKVSRGEQPTQTSLQPPLMHKRIKGLRPAPLDLNSDISPSDQTIPIGITVPSAALSNHTHSPQSAPPYSSSPPHSQQSQRYGQEVSTPTIVITPAKEDFDVELTISPEDMRSGGSKFSLSLQSGRSNGSYGSSAPSEGTPPVPPLPLFAAQSNASLRSAARESTATEFEEERSVPSSRRTHALSVCTAFEEDEGSPPCSGSSEVDSRRISSQSQVPTPRRSNGWWNVITSPFVSSAKSGAFSFRSPPIPEEDEDLESQPMLSGASEIGFSDRSGPAFTDREPEDDELRSAPPTNSAPLTNYSAQSLGSGMSMRTPARSDTAPGALDTGSANSVNIYRTPSEGAASAYYDSNRSFPSMIGPATGGSAGSMGDLDSFDHGSQRGMDDLDDFDPPQSGYHEAGSAGVAFEGGETPIDIDGGMRESELYRVPSQGEAASYYDSNRTFPSLVPHGEAYGDPGMEDWTPRRSVSREPSARSLGFEGGSGDFVESPMDMGSPRDLCGYERDGSFADGQSVGGGFGDRSAPNTGAVSAFGAEQSYASNRSPFDDTGFGAPSAPNTGAASAFGPAQSYASPQGNAFSDRSALNTGAASAFGAEQSFASSARPSVAAGFGDRSAPNTGAASAFRPEQSYASNRSPFDDAGFEAQSGPNTGAQSAFGSGHSYASHQENGFGTASAPNTGFASAFGSDQSYASNRSPFEDAQSIGPDDYFGAPSGQGQVVEKSPFDSGDAAEFEGFSGAYASSERKFFSTPSTAELNGQTPGPPLTANTDLYGLQSPMSETTPIVECASMATYMGPKSSNGELREVDVASMRTQTPLTTGTSVGLANGTIASRDGQQSACDPSMEAMSEKIPYSVASQHSRNGSQGLGIYDNESERALFPPSQPLSEKPSMISNRSARMDAQGMKDEQANPPWYRRFFWLLAAIACLLLALLVVLLILFIPHRQDDRPAQAQWLNLTGFPPLPTGIATVVGPSVAKEVSGCVNPQQLWDCAVPAGGSITSDRQHKPDFRFEIRFRNHTLPSNETAVVFSNNTTSMRSMGQAAQARAIVQRGLLSSSIFSSSPSPPSEEDQLFLGRTADGVNQPYNGEETPFYISLLNTSALVPDQVSELKKRDSGFRYPYPSSSSATPSPTSSSGTNPQRPSTNTSSNTPSAIPHPAFNGHGRPAEAQLYPFAYAQPLRLFNRGQDSEHYGFYTYFDRTIYISSTSNTPPSGNSSSFGGTVISNVPLSDASAVCTWSQTRLLVQLWTRKVDVTSLNTTAPVNIPVVDSSGNDMAAPGSFPYPVTVTLDRHGGDASEKGVFCYGLDDDQHVIESVKSWIDENRSYGGTLVHPAPVPTNSDAALSRSADDSNAIDGGTGGCTCQWRNWE